MRVRVLERTRLYWNYAVHEVEKDAEIVGEFARHLFDNTAAGTVEVLEDDPVPEAPAEGAAGAATAPGSAEDPGDAQTSASGSIEDVMAWVGDDKSRAAQALADEQARDKPRATLVKRLGSLAE